MSTRAVDADASNPASPLAAAAAPPLAPIAIDPDLELASDLPRDHPAWMRDTLSVSQRARSLLERLRPTVVKVVRFWEHRVRSIVVGGRRLSVDFSGSYRLD